VLESIGRWLEPGEPVARFAPYRRQLSAWSYVYRANNTGLAERLNARDAWAPSLFDGDASLCAGLVMSDHERVLTGNMTAAVGSV